MWNPFRKKAPPPAPPVKGPSPGGIVAQAVGHAGGNSRKRAGPAIQDVMSAAVLAVTATGKTDKASFDRAMAKARADLKAARLRADATRANVTLTIGERNFSIPPG